MSGPSGDKLIYVNMTDQSVDVRDLPDEWKLLGGRALSAKILLADCDPTCDPLGPDNVLVMAPGVLSGTAAPTSGRISIGGKSPLTGGIKEANTGGQPGQHLVKLGYRGIVVTGQPASADARYGLNVTADGVEVVAADEHKGKWNYALCMDLHGQYPKTTSFITMRARPVSMQLARAPRSPAPTRTRCATPGAPRRARRPRRRHGQPRA